MFAERQQGDKSPLAQHFHRIVDDFNLRTAYRLSIVHASSLYGIKVSFAEPTVAVERHSSHSIFI